MSYNIITIHSININILIFSIINTSCFRNKSALSYIFKYFCTHYLTTIIHNTSFIHHTILSKITLVSTSRTPNKLHPQFLLGDFSVVNSILQLLLLLLRRNLLRSTPVLS